MHDVMGRRFATRRLYYRLKLERFVRRALSVLRESTYDYGDPIGTKICLYLIGAGAAYFILRVALPAIWNR